MQGLLNVLKSRYFLIAVGTALLIGLVWMGGAWLGWSTTTRLLGVIVVLVVCITLLVISVVRANKAAAGIEQSIRQQAEEQKMSTRPDRRAEIEEVQDQLERAIAKLKKSKLGRGRRGKSALYALPWYLFVGPPGAGKTTAIAESGLNFPIGNDSVRGVGGTRNCDWFFSDSAILLDTAGRYMTEEEDTEEWHAFLDMLKEHRSDRPINGVLVGISIAELADADAQDIEWHADRIRRRIDELIERLGVHFPIYLVFTKCDLLKGFVDFFGDLPRRDRQQVWGHTFEQTGSEDAAGEEGENGEARSENLRERFEGAFDGLTNALLGRRSERLRRSMKRAKRRRVYVFPLEVAAVKDSLARFVSRLFQPNPYEENPIFRGFYFTSGTQEGVPLDRVIESVGQQFDLAPEQTGGFDPEMETKSYFLTDLFTDVIVPDQYLVSQTSSAAKKGWLKRAGVSVAAVVLLVLFVLGASQALVRSNLSLGRVESAAEGVQEVNWSDTDGSALAGAFGRMDQLRGEVVRLQDYEEDPPLLGWGLYRGGQVIAPAQKLYYQKARGFIYAYPFQQLEGQLRRATRRQSVTGARREAVRADLRAYLLMSDEAPRLQEDVNGSFLKSHLTTLLDSTLLRTTQVPQDQREAFSAQTRRQVAAFVDGMSDDTTRAFQAKPSLISGVRNLIYQEPSIAGLYRRIKEQGVATLPPFKMEKAVPRRDLRLFTTQPQVPGFFTKAGWKNFAKDAIEEQGQHPGEGDWVLGHTPEDLPEEMRDPDKVVAELKKRYYGEYASQWQRFLRSVKFNPFNDVGTAVRTMSRLANPNDSPVLYLLAQVSDQTTFQNKLVAGAKNQAKEAVQRKANRKARQLTRNPRAGVGGNDDEKKLHPIDRRFTALHDLKAGRAASGDASSALMAAMDELRRVRGELDKMRSGGNEKAATYAAEAFKNNGGEMARALRSVRGSLNRINTQVRRSLFDEPLLYSWGAILSAAQKHLNQRWRTAVYQPFKNTLAGSYPFDNSSSQGAPLMDMENFFTPDGGVVSTFYQQELSPFLGRDMKPRTWEGRGLHLSASARRTLQKVQRISDELFNSGVMQVSFELQPELTQSSDGAPPVDQVFVSVNGQDNTYRNGSYRPWISCEWPGSGGVRLNVSTQEGDMTPKQFDGPWAFFRLLEEANVQQTAPAKYRLRWSFQRPGRYTVTARYNLRTQSSSAPFDNVRGFFSFHPPSSLN